MPQYDLYHQPVKHALIKDGWTITDDPYTLTYKGLRLYADLGAEQRIAADFFRQPAIQDIVAAHAMRLLVFEPKREEIVAWIS
jgi:hypothetical protein